MPRVYHILYSYKIQKKSPQEKGKASTAKGAPRKDYSSQLRGFLLQLKDANENTKKYFSHEWKNVRRNCDNYIKGVRDNDFMGGFISIASNPYI